MAVIEESEAEVELVKFVRGKVEAVVERLPSSLLYIVVEVDEDPDSEGDSVDSSGDEDPDSEGDSVDSSGGRVEAMDKRLPSSSLYIVVVGAEDEGDSVARSGGMVEVGAELLP